MRGFGSLEAAARFCRAFDALRHFERYRRTRAEAGSLAERRQQFVAGTAALQAMLLTA
jgi:putative transposase